MIGKTISHYKILEKLGEGGMGVVYKAQDTRLDRLVALKFLPAHLSASEQDKGRFIQEAKAAAALNHPNVCSVIDIQEHDGQQFIVMEYVEGKTLRQKITDGGAGHVQPLRLDDVISYAIQIGEALQEAHSKGVVHRDIKADNVMVNTKNQIKVMDFGLAKLKGSLKLTRTSSTVGTLAYMAPEQIQGGEVDARSDIFSFGVLLFEMLTGKFPFRGEHEAALVYSIVNEEPEPIHRYRPEVSSELVHILNRTLEKNPDERYQSVTDMLIDLRRSKKETTRVSREYVSGTQQVEQTRLSTTVGQAFMSVIKKPIALLSLAAFLAVAGFALWLLMKPSSLISENLIFKPLQVPFTTIWYPGLSADGNWIAFPATDENNVTEIYYMHASGGEPKRLTNDSLFKYTADISPDGSQIIYERSKSRDVRFFFLEMHTISTLGGMSRKLTDTSLGARWSPDGKSIAYMGITSQPRGPALLIINADGSNKRVIFEDTTGGPGNRISLAWSPDGKAIAWLRNFPGIEGRYQEIIIRELETGKERQLTFDKKNIDEVYWMPQGEIIFSSNRNGPSNLWAIPSDGGAPVQITRGPGPDMGIKASLDGKRILYLQQAPVGALYVADLHGLNERQITPDDQFVRNPLFSPDGRQIAYRAGDPDPLKLIFYLSVVDLEGRQRRQLTSRGENIQTMAWSPDGRKIAYSYFDGSETQRSDSTMKVAVIDVENPVHRSLVGNGFVIGWLKDGSSLNVVLNQTSYRVPIQGWAKEKMFEDSTVVASSPDGLKLGIGDFRSGRTGLWVKIKEKSPRKLLESVEGVIGWTPNSRRIAYTSNGQLWSVAVETGKRERYEWRNPEVVAFDGFSPDGKHTVFVKYRTNAKLILIDNVH